MEAGFVREVFTAVEGFEKYLPIDSRRCDYSRMASVLALTVEWKN